MAKKRAAGKRDRVTTPTGSFYTKRTAGGEFKELDEVGRSQRADRRVKAKTATKSGFGDQGDQKRTTKRAAKKRATKKR
jgi:hypothetical protein